MSNEERLMTLRARLFKMIEKEIAEDPHHKSYEGAISIELPNYFEDGSTGFYAINLDCYVLGWQRHYTVSGKTFAEALDKFEKLLDEFEAEEKRMAEKPKKSCGNCIQCEKYESNGKEQWSCENYDRGPGMPVDCSPPNDEACSNWSDDPKEKDRPQDELRDFVDHFWDERDD